MTCFAYCNRRVTGWLLGLGLFFYLGGNAAGQCIPIRNMDVAPRLTETIQDGGAPPVADQTLSNAADQPDERVRTGVNFASGKGTVSEDDYQPLTGRERWIYYLRATYWSPAAVFGAFGPAVGAHLGDSPPEWGGGVKGYGRRFASEFANNVVTNSIQSGLAALLKHEPRYVRSAKKGVLKRTAHALAFVFVTYNDEGKIRPAIANIVADYGGAFAQIAWYPSRYTVRGDGVRLGNLALSFNFVTNLINEFTPDIKRVFKRK
ncbi:MAG: hypothetical protein NZ585_00445 [Chloracidobacterium sp.]|nr:hypothetical protein [Chloracidobacterium sp.]MDW8216525.1 hypothetical protein [Acidobacteriota bacterium]